MGELKGFLIDLAGVLYEKDKLIQGTKEVIDLLKENGFKYRFLSNTTQKRRTTITKNLKKLGLDIKAEEIFTPPVAAIKYLSSKNKNRCYLLSTGDIHEEFEEIGIKLTDNEVDFVIIGDAADNFNFKNLNKAFRLILGGAELIALEKDRYWMGTEGYMLSAGPFVVGLEYATDKIAIVMGKPSKAFFQMGLNELELKPNEAAMIGDDIYTDIEGGKKIGMKGILVKTGKYNEKLVKESGIEPDFIINSIADIKNLL